jgi:hypothetical protein
MENQLENSMLRYSQLQTGNRNLRFEIDVMRKEYRNLIRANKSIVVDVSVITDEARRLNQ